MILAFKPSQIGIPCEVLNICVQNKKYVRTLNKKN